MVGCRPAIEVDDASQTRRRGRGRTSSSRRAGGQPFIGIPLRRAINPGPRTPLDRLARRKTYSQGRVTHKALYHDPWAFDFGPSAVRSIGRCGPTDWTLGQDRLERRRFQSRYDRRGGRLPLVQDEAPR